MEILWDHLCPGVESVGTLLSDLQDKYYEYFCSILAVRLLGCTAPSSATFSQSKFIPSSGYSPSSSLVIPHPALYSMFSSTRLLAIPSTFSYLILRPMQGPPEVAGRVPPPAGLACAHAHAASDPSPSLPASCKESRRARTCTRNVRGSYVICMIDCRRARTHTHTHTHAHTHTHTAHMCMI